MQRRSTRTFVLPVVWIVLATLLGSHQSVVRAVPNPPAAVSTLDADAEGWTVNNGALTPDFFATGGAAGGYISATDAEIGPRWYWVAPPKFLGDMSAVYDKALGFYLRQSKSTFQLNVQRDVVLSGNGMSIYFDTRYNPNTEWTRYSIPLNEAAGWKRTNTDQPVTQAELQALLGALTELRIEGDYSAGVDTSSIDQVELGAEQLIFRPIYLPLVQR